MKSTSLIRRVLLTVLFAELLCAVAFACTALLHERNTRFRAFDETLRGRSDSLLGAVQDAEDPADNVYVDPTELALPAADVYAVYNKGGRLLGASAHAPAALIARGQNGFSDRVSEGHDYRLLQREALRIIDREESGGVGLRRPVTIIYGARTNHIWHEIFEAARFYALVSLFLLCGTTILLFVLLRRVLRPINALAVAAAGISANSVNFDPPAEAVNLRELQPLVAALSAAMSRLRKAFDSQHRFVGDATHELKTAVAVVRSTVQVLTLKARSQEEYHAGLMRVLNDNSRVEELVSRMLLLARFEERAADTSEIVNLTRSVEAVVERLGSFAEVHGVALATSLTAGVPVRLAEERIEVLLSNLIVNAVQHSKRGTTVHIGLGRSQSIAVLKVSDSGTGISREALPYIFERFYRADSSRSRETGGAGLGLAICHAIVDGSGGSIEVESAPGEGTTMRVSFRVG